MENPQETKSISMATGSGLSRLWGGANSTRVLIAVNVIPVVGVLFFDWGAFNVVFLFWLENLVIGFFAVLKMVTADPGKMSMREMGGLFASMIPKTKFSQHLDRLPDDVDVSLGPVSSRASLFFLVPFFCVHYGIFMLGHGFFIVFLLGDGEAGFREGSVEPLPGMISREHSSGSIGPSHTGCEPYEKKFCCRIPHTGDRTTPVVRVFFVDSGKIGHQAGAGLALNHLAGRYFGGLRIAQSLQEGAKGMSAAPQRQGT